MSQPDKIPSPPRLVEGIDYYIEAGRWVFTAVYLQRRGECCSSGCRHCPYGGAGVSKDVAPKTTR